MCSVSVITDELGSAKKHLALTQVADIIYYFDELPRSKLRGITYGIRSIDSQQAAGN